MCIKSDYRDNSHSTIDNDNTGPISESTDPRVNRPPQPWAITLVKGKNMKIFTLGLPPTCNWMGHCSYVK